jgi:release factor glutamine methyltransferase
MRVGDAIDRAARRLAGDSARLEAQLLLGHVMHCERAALLAHPERELTGAQAEAFLNLVQRRTAAEPIAYLLGEREFYGHVFRVDQRALIPRPETELLVELGTAAVQRLRADGVEPVVVEIGTGSGAVAVALALAAGCRVVGTDLSYAALTLARENAARLGGSVSFVQSDLIHALRGSVHVIVANLPYVPSARELPADVREYEPHMAIFGGPRGTELIERLLQEARRVLAPGGEIGVELDEEEQAQPIASLARQLYPEAAVEVHRDGGGYDRVVRIVGR